MKFRRFKLSYFQQLFLVFGLVLAASCQTNATEYKNYDVLLAEIIEANGLNASQIALLIDKSDYKLTVLVDTLVIKEYPVVFGKNPVDDKLRQGDQCTPEGTFKMLSKYPHKNWSKFIWINYPNNESWQKHNTAKREGLIPQNSKIGGEIGIHGVPDGADIAIDLKLNWTLGCISMKNKDINELYPYVSKSTEIVIRK